MVSYALYVYLNVCFYMLAGDSLCVCGGGIFCLFVCLFVIYLFLRLDSMTSKL